MMNTTRSSTQSSTQSSARSSARSSAEGTRGAAKAPAGAAPVLGTRALNRATLERQLLLRRSADLSVKDAVAHLLGLQAQNVKPPYYALAARLENFDPLELSALMEAREAVRIVTMRSTIHLHTAEDALALRPMMQPALEREMATVFRKGLVGVDLEELAVLAREAVEAEPRTMKQLREVLLVRWPDADPQSLAIAARCVLPLVQVTPRGLWRRSGQVALTTLEHWLGDGAGERRPVRGGASGSAVDALVLGGAPGSAVDALVLGGASGSAVDALVPGGASGSAVDALVPGGASGSAVDALVPGGAPASAVDATVLRYLAAFGPASVKDMQTWARLTRLREVFERLRPGLRTYRDENGVELFDLPDAPRPDADTPAPPRFLPEFDNLLLSHADRARVVPAEYKGRTWKGNFAYCVFLLDGFLGGVWRLEEDAKGGGAVLTIEPFGRVSRAERELSLIHV
ncbi:winged helix DNA-binding domain-containing protein [Streptomyces sp. MZ04]|uniref:winged helix DNA-binding domain-containing protein n=1 Tax=Streptomyces sp. MZ04 TaxID=2559236 RepID=UPI00107E7EA9|nr:winged helix DNA-binding domain-containing protein [Streptomyces sp. MZ04]TGA87985.1 winged helix DNA-binding domain-containing protein [Streptomyces sp. MZ04]